MTTPATAATPDVAAKAADAAAEVRKTELAAIEAAAAKKAAEAKAAEKAAKEKQKEADKQAKAAQKLAEKAKREAEVLAAKAKRDAEKEKERAEKAKKQEQARKAKEGEKKAKHTELLRQLKPLATEINVRFEKAAKLEADADDHRLAAALRLEESRKLCEAQKLNFKTWAEENVKQSYETVRKLVFVAQQPEPAKALEDMRNKNKEANKAARERAKAAVTDGTTSGEGSKKPAAAVKPTPKLAAEVLEGIKPEDQLKVVRAAATNLGMAVVSKTDADAAAQLKKTPAKVGAEAVKAAFSAMKGKEKMDFVKWAAAEVGMVLTTPALTDPGSKGPDAAKVNTAVDDIPDALKRS